MKLFTLTCVFALCVASAMAVSIVVAPSTGTTGLNPTDTILDAVAQVNAGGDASNTITLRSTEGAIVLTDNEVWNINGGKSIDFVAESGNPIVVLNGDGAARWMVEVIPVSEETYTFTGISFVPESAQTYGNNVQDGFSFGASNYSFTNCVFSANDGADGVLTATAATADFTTPGNNVGDDWCQFGSSSGTTADFTGCALSGSFDDALLVGGNVTLTLDGDTIINAVGGAGIQVFGSLATVTCDGSVGGSRIIIANCGLRSGAADTGLKTFGASAEFNLTQTDVLDVTNGGLYDFAGPSTWNLTDVRVAFANVDNASPGGNLVTWTFDGTSGVDNGIWNLTRVTNHDCLGVAQPHGWYGQEGATQPYQTVTIIDSIFSGAGDTYDEMTNSTASGGSSSVGSTFSAHVTSGPDALPGVGDLGVGAVFNDPIYISYTYAATPGATNDAFLLPSNPAYATANSGSGPLVGGSPGAFVSVPVELSVFSSD